MSLITLLSTFIPRLRMNVRRWENTFQNTFQYTGNVSVITGTLPAGDIDLKAERIFPDVRGFALSMEKEGMIVQIWRGAFSISGRSPYQEISLVIPLSEELIPPFETSDRSAMIFAASQTGCYLVLDMMVWDPGAEGAMSAGQSLGLSKRYSDQEDLDLIAYLDGLGGRTIPQMSLAREMGGVSGILRQMLHPVEFALLPGNDKPPIPGRSVGNLESAIDLSSGDRYSKEGSLYHRFSPYARVNLMDFVGQLKEK